MKNEWINIKDRMPEKDGRYLVVEDHSNNWVGICSVRNGTFDMQIKYWQELPRCPE